MASLYIYSVLITTALTRGFRIFLDIAIKYHYWSNSDWLFSKLCRLL